MKERVKQRVKARVNEGMKAGAKFSKCRRYRYALWRVWNEQQSYVQFIGLNPSTADEVVDDPTLIRCMNFAKAWGYGGVYMTNLFAYRATAPETMKQFDKPIGPRNNFWITKLVSDAGVVVAAWGNDGEFMNRCTEITTKVPELHCLKMNKSGQPAHPLYLKANLKPVLMNAG